jgi:hypothetical protein
MQLKIFYESEMTVGEEVTKMCCTASKKPYFKLNVEHSWVGKQQEAIIFTFSNKIPK